MNLEFNHWVFVAPNVFLLEFLEKSATLHSFIGSGGTKYLSELVAASFSTRHIYLQCHLVLSAEPHVWEKLVPMNPIMLFWFGTLGRVMSILQFWELMHFSFHESVDFSI